MKESYRRRITCRKHSRFAHPMKTGGKSGHTAIANVGDVPVVHVVFATPPIDSVLPGQQLVEGSHARALDTPQLVNRATFRRGLSETHLEHFAHHFEARVC